MKKAIAVSLLLAAAIASPAARADSFESLAARAQRLEALEPFLARYVGRCTDRFERAACEANVAAARRALSGKIFAVRVPDAAPLVRTSLDGEKFLLLVTPFVDGGGLALTNGAPKRQDGAGHPIVGLVPIRGTLPSGMMEMDFQGPFRTGAIELEIVFRPERTWKMKRKGETGELEGVAARFLGIRVLDARTGNEIASRTL